VGNFDWIFASSGGCLLFLNLRLNWKEVLGMS
jgi:hypothetical protein